MRFIYLALILTVFQLGCKDKGEKYYIQAEKALQEGAEVRALQNYKKVLTFPKSKYVSSSKEMMLKITRKIENTRIEKTVGYGYKNYTWGLSHKQILAVIKKENTHRVVIKRPFYIKIEKHNKFWKNTPYYGAEKISLFFDYKTKKLNRIEIDPDLSVNDDQSESDKYLKRLEKDHGQCKRLTGYVDKFGLPYFVCVWSSSKTSILYRMAKRTNKIKRTASTLWILFEKK